MSSNSPAPVASDPDSGSSSPSPGMTQMAPPLDFRGPSGVPDLAAADYPFTSASALSSSSSASSGTLRASPSRPLPRTRSMTDIDYVLATAITLLDARRISAVVRAAQSITADVAQPHPVEEVLTKLIVDVAERWAADYTPNGDVQELLCRKDEEIAALQRALAQRPPAPQRDVGAALRLGGSASAPPLAFAASSLPVNALSASARLGAPEPHERDDFWRSWQNWSKVTWSAEVEKSVRTGIKRDVIDSLDNDLKQKSDLEALLESLMRSLFPWRGLMPSEDMVRELTLQDSALRRFWLRHIASSYSKGQRGLAITAAASTLESSGLTTEQREAKAAAMRAVLLGQGISWGHADSAASSGIHAASLRPALTREGGRSQSFHPGRAGSSHTRGGGRGRGAVRFMALCHGCGKRGHLQRDCPNGSRGESAPPSNR